MTHSRRCDGAKRRHHRQPTRHFLGRQSSAGCPRLYCQPLDHLQILHCGGARFHGRRRAELPKHAYSDITNVNSIPAYVIGNALLAYITPRWSLSLNVKNITNECYFVAANAAGAFVGIPLAPMSRCECMRITRACPLRRVAGLAYRSRRPASALWMTRARSFGKCEGCERT